MFAVMFFGPECSWVCSDFGVGKYNLGVYCGYKDDGTCETETDFCVPNKTCYINVFCDKIRSQEAEYLSVGFFSRDCFWLLFWFGA